MELLFTNDRRAQIPELGLQNQFTSNIILADEFDAHKCRCGKKIVKFTQQMNCLENVKESLHSSNTQEPASKQYCAKAFGDIEKITLVVDNKKFTLNRDLLVAHPETMLGRMFGSGIELAKPNQDGEFEVASGISSEIFGAILKYYQGDVICCPRNVPLDDLRKACDYLMIPFDLNTVISDDIGGLMQILSEQTVAKSFQKFLFKEIFPKAMKALNEFHRECIFIILSEKDVIHDVEALDQSNYRVPEYPIFNGDMYRCLINPKNINGAKETMKRFGLKEFEISLGYLKQCKKKYERFVVVQSGNGLEWYPGEEKSRQRPFLKLCWDAVNNYNGNLPEAF